MIRVPALALAFVLLPVIAVAQGTTAPSAGAATQIAGCPIANVLLTYMLSQVTPGAPDAAVKLVQIAQAAQSLQTLCRMVNAPGGSMLFRYDPAVQDSFTGLLQKLILLRQAAVEPSN